MANNQIKRLLEFANLQMATEAFLLREGDSGVVPEEIQARLVQGNFHASVFTATQAAEFVANYEVLAQIRNDPTLAGGTGFRNKADGSYILNPRTQGVKGRFPFAPLAGSTR